MSQDNVRPPRQFNEAYKNQVVSLVLDKGLSRNKVASENDLTWLTVDRWIRKYEQAQKKPAKRNCATPETCEDLRKDNAALREHIKLLLDAWSKASGNRRLNGV